VGYNLRQRTQRPTFHPNRKIDERIQLILTSGGETMSRTLTSPEAVGISSERLARIRPVMQTYVDQHGVAGISTLLARRGQVVHFEQVGWQDRESQTRLAPDTIYRIYSMTKPIICTAFMTLFEAGRFQLSDPLAKFLPAFGQVRVRTQTAAGAQEVELARPITLRDLLTHTAGLTYGFLEASPVAELYRQAGMMEAGGTLEALISKLARLPLAYQPGTHWHYSVAIDVIAHLIEVISGRPLQEFLRERVFAPLGMVDTAFSVPAEKMARLATMYGHPDIARHSTSQFFDAWTHGDNERRDVEATYPAAYSPGFARGGHGLFSTAGDYLRFAQMLLNRGELDGVRILGPKIVELMHLNHVPAALLPYEIAGVYSGGYGFGLGSRVLLNVAESGMPGSVGEFGWAGAAKTYYWVDPQEQLVGVFMSQYMMSYDNPDLDFRVLAYQALIE
jgi:CubicO group peptidase (beta-lactamase class C family)